jgi:purine-binding chemotaxis protein CheW
VNIQINDMDTDRDGVTYLLLHVGAEIYAVQGDSVREIARWHDPVIVPGSPPVLPGIINQRGVILPVINTYALFGLPESAPSRSSRYVIVQYDDIDMALVVDAVTDLINLSTQELEAVPAALDPQRARLLKAIARMDDMPVALLDLAPIITMLRSGA